MTEDERFQQICDPRMRANQEASGRILRILEGENGTPGLAENVRDLAEAFEKLQVLWNTVYGPPDSPESGLVSKTTHHDKIITRIWIGTGAVVLAVLTQAGHWLFEVVFWRK